ncbi:hypothetical protein ACIP98_29205 [Streptomyces sp. NPDC088354]|uniref:hypothetical protein n=1 Tax=Streptomyces sp. NPDC088354 TaxID=3365856 RepID=UPI0038223FDB
MPRPRRPRSADAFPYDFSPKTSPDVFTAAADALTARGWQQGETFRMLPSRVRADEVCLAPIVGDVDVPPGNSEAEWRDQEHKNEWYHAARRLAAAMSEAGWSSYGTTQQGTSFRRNAGPLADSVPESAELAAAPPGAPVRLAAIAAEVGVKDGDLDDAIREAAHEEAADAYNGGARPELDDDGAHRAVHADAERRAADINNAGLGAQLGFLYAQCASEAAFRSLLTDLLPS